MVVVEIEMDSEKIKMLIFALKYHKMDPLKTALIRFRCFMCKELLPMWVERAKKEEKNKELV